MYKPTRKDRRNPFFRRYFILKDVSITIQTALVIFAIYVSIRGLVQDDYWLFFLYCTVVWIPISVAWLCWECYDSFRSDLAKSSDGHIYRYKDVPNGYVEVKDSYQTRKANFRAYLIDNLTAYRDHLAKVTDLQGEVYVTYPVEDEVRWNSYTWTGVKSSGKGLAFAEPFTFDKNLVRLVFKNPDGTYSIKSLDPYDMQLSHRGTVVELQGYTLPLKVATQAEAP